MRRHKQCVCDHAVLQLMFPVVLLGQVCRYYAERDGRTNDPYADCVHQPSLGHGHEEAL